MDKQMIEEMAKVVQGNMCGDRPCEECNYHGFKTKILPRYCEVYLIAEKLYKAVYRKIPENAVVLTDEELNKELDTIKVVMIVHDDDGERYVSYDDYKEFTDRLGKIARQRKVRIEQLEKLLDDRCDSCIERTRKETAEKFAERVKMAFYYHFDELIPSIMADKIDEICKEIIGGV